MIARRFAKPCCHAHRVSVVAGAHGLERNDILRCFSGAMVAAAVVACGPAAAKMKSTLPVCDNLRPAYGIEYCDSKPGRGERPEAGDQIVLNYTAVAVANERPYGGSRNFSFVVGEEDPLIFEGWTRAIVGGEDLPAIERGGVRTIRVPPNLAFGELGNACIFGLPDKCMVPPNSAVDITFEYLGYK